MSVEEVTQTHLLRKSKSTGGLKTARKTERAERPTKRPCPGERVGGGLHIVPERVFDAGGSGVVPQSWLECDTRGGQGSAC
ncbi:hypothetical protein AB0K14_40450 [Actinosynnema sp. NPDC050801]|uniref:hypothetical protein n=1 Tax=unclassified Actinosynnema TaxID=2637065 RepID=UPI0033F90BB5